MVNLFCVHVVAEGLNTVVSAGVTVDILKIRRVLKGPQTQKSRGRYKNGVAAGGRGSIYGYIDTKAMLQLLYCHARPEQA
jgi:hypothetical protein